MRLRVSAHVLMYRSFVSLIQYRANMSSQEDVESSMCNICNEQPVGPIEPPSDKCGHDPSACRDCLDTWIQSKIEEDHTTIKCPDCGAILENNDIRKWVDQATFEKLLTLNYAFLIASTTDNTTGLLTLQSDSLFSVPLISDTVQRQTAEKASSMPMPIASLSSSVLCAEQKHAPFATFPGTKASPVRNTGPRKRDETISLPGQKCSGSRSHVLYARRVLRSSMAVCA